MNTNFNDGTIYDYKRETNLLKYKGFFKTVGIIIALFLLALIIINSVTYTVDEREQVVIKQFNEVVKVIADRGMGDVIRNTNQLSPQLSSVKVSEGKGLFFKIPFIQKDEHLTNMLLNFDTGVGEVTTLDKKKLVLDFYAQWRIYNPALFVISLKNERNANARLDDIIYSRLNQEIGKVDAHVVISNKEYLSEMLSRVIENTNEQMKDMGVEVVDVRIRRTDLPVENYNNIFNRMRTERERAASLYRSEGREEAQKIRSEADREATIIEATAYEEAQRIRGEGDAEALKIYAEAYNRDPEFYAFWRTLQSYKKTLNGNTKIVIDPNSEFAKYLFNVE